MSDSPKRVLICGGRRFSDREAVETLVASLPSDAVVIHGAAPGADSLAGACARTAGLTVEEYPADWKQYGRGAGLVRNRQMLTDGKPDIVYAFPDCPLPKSKGTRNMVEQAIAAGVPVEVMSG